MKIILLMIDVSVLMVILYNQVISYKDTKEKISQLGNFFGTNIFLRIFHSSITRNDLEIDDNLNNFISKPRRRKIPTIGDEDDDSETDLEYFDVDLIRATNNNVSDSFKEVIHDTNAYLCKNIGSSADLTIFQDICERKIESLESQIASTINAPLYYGLVGTFAGIITGVIGIATNTDDLFSSSDMSSLTTLLVGVGSAMVVSTIGLCLMIKNSTKNLKKARINCTNNKNKYYDFLRRELMPTLSASMASSINSLKNVLGSFIGKFGHNLDAYVNSTELINSNIKEQHLLLVELNKLNQAEMAKEIANTFSNLKDAADSLNTFQTYQNKLNTTVSTIDNATSRINDIIESFNSFASALNTVISNQGTATELQKQFKEAIEQHFPTGSETREIWRKQFDGLTEDATKVSTELLSQLKASTECIYKFTQKNQEAFTSLDQLGNAIHSLVEYSNVQAECYKDLKQEIHFLKKEQAESRSNYAKLNADLLIAVKEMVNAVESINK